MMDDTVHIKGNVCMAIGGSTAIGDFSLSHGAQGDRKLFRIHSAVELNMLTEV